MSEVSMSRNQKSHQAAHTAASRTTSGLRLLFTHTLVLSGLLLAVSGCITTESYQEGPGCTNTCGEGELAMNNQCDDGSQGDGEALCARGTDCADCGPVGGGEGDGDGGGGGTTRPNTPTTDIYSCSYQRKSSFHCPGQPLDTGTWSSGCAPIRAASQSEANSECRDRTRSRTSCSGSCCSRTRYQNVSVTAGGC
jgi:hypothetical protein